MALSLTLRLNPLSRDGDTRIVHARIMGQEKEFKADQILMALRREANTQGMGLENLGVDLDKNGAIVVDKYQQSSNPAIYASGDVTNNPEFVYEVKKSTVNLEYVARAQTARDTRGFIKLVADEETNRLLGAHIVGAEAGEVIQTVTLAIKFS